MRNKVLWHHIMKQFFSNIINYISDFFIPIKHLTWPDFKKIWHWTYLTDTAVSTDSAWIPALFIFFVVLMLVGIVINFFLIRRQKRLPIYNHLRVHIINYVTWIGLTGIFLTFARYQALYFLSSRILLFSLFVVMIVWGGWIIFYTVVKLPSQRKNYLEKQNFERYLPKNHRQSRRMKRS